MEYWSNGVLGPKVRLSTKKLIADFEQRAGDFSGTHYSNTPVSVRSAHRMRRNSTRSRRSLSVSFSVVPAFCK